MLMLPLALPTSQPETYLAVMALLWKDGSDVDREEAMRRWKIAPLPSKQKMATFDETERAKGWPMSAREAARTFLQAVPPLPPEPVAPPAEMAEATP